MNPKTKLEIRALLERSHKAKYPERYSDSTSNPKVNNMDEAYDTLHEAVRLLVPNPFGDARATMAEEFQDKSQGSVYHTYHANLCMLFHDRWNYSLRVCEAMATAVMQLIFES